MVFLLFPHAKVHIFHETTKRCHDYLICAKEGFQNIAVRGKAPTVRKTTDSNNLISPDTNEFNCQMLIRRTHINE